MELTPESFYRFLNENAKGKVNAIKAPELRKRLQLEPEPPRMNGGYALFRHLASAATKAGMPVVGDHNGYYVPATEEEALDSAFDLRSRASSLMARADALEFAMVADAV